MKVLVATHITQGDDSGDYCWTVDGELVTPLGLVCSNEACGCDRGFSGLASCCATTTAMVVELAHIKESDLERAVTDSLERSGWLEGATPVKRRGMIEDTVGAIMDVANGYGVGTIVCRDGDLVYARESLAA
jgi:hypothetical protein